VNGVLTELLSAEGIAGATGGVVRRPAAGAARGVSTDSRTVGRGDLFIALRGPRFDGHDYLAEAFRGGAWGALVERESWSPDRAGAIAEAYPDRAVIAVGNTERGLGDLAASRRRGLAVRVVAVTGSNGKTTTKEMISSIAAERWRVHRNEGNLNNLIGLPLTVLALDEGHEVAVLEMGMNRRGEIRRLAEIARPEVGVVTNVGPVHLEHLGSEEGVAAAKAELFEAMGSAGTAVLSVDDRHRQRLLSSVGGRKVTFGLGRGADFSARDLRPSADATAFTLTTPLGERQVRIAFLGEHNVRNALASAAAAFALGAGLEEIGAGLGKARPVPMRFSVLTFRGGIRVVNDAYNANPVSMKAALDSLGLLPGARRRIAVLGDMRELGAAAAASHRRLGAAAAAAGIDLLVAVGDFAVETAAGAAEGGMAPGQVLRAPAAPAAAALLGGRLAEGDLVLLKGSRAVGLEKVIALLVAQKVLVEVEE